MKSHSGVSRWLANRKAIEKQAASAGKRKATLHPGRRSQYHALERLRRWLMCRRNRRFAVTKWMMIWYAKHWSEKPDLC